MATPPTALKPDSSRQCNAPGDAPSDTPQAHDERHWRSVWTPDTLEARTHDLYRSRLARVRAFMRRSGLPALLIVDPNNIFYATGARNMMVFCLRAPTRYLLVLEPGPTVLYEYGGAEHLASGLPTIDHIKPSIAVSYLGSAGMPGDACERFAREIADAVRMFGGGIDTLGVDRFPFRATDALRHQGFHLRDADEVFVPARAVKLPIEMPYVRESMRRVLEGVERLEQAIAPGRTEAQVWAEFWFDLMQKDGQYVTTRLFQSGPNTFPYFQECGGRVMQRGDLVCLDTDALGFEGYSSDLSRSFLCGDGAPNPVQRQLYQLAREQIDTNAARLRPGMAWREFAERAWACPDAYRPTRYGLIGHGLGLAGEFPNIPHHDPALPYPEIGHIEPGMVVCLESYIGSPEAGQGIKLENQYLVHDTGVECLSPYPWDRRLGH